MAEEIAASAAVTAAPGEWDAVEGHARTKARLQTLLREKRTPHAMLFSGPRGVGKRKLAAATAAALLCLSPKDGLACGGCESCRHMASGTHPDFYAVTPEKSGKAARSIKIEQIRDLRAEAARVPRLSARRVILLDDAETMNEAASNALLKTLEEPMGNTSFLLVTGARQTLLPTILSRCMEERFAPLDDEATARVLEARGVPEEARLPLIALSEGSAGRALRLFEEDALAYREDALSTLESLPGLPAEEVFSLGARLGAMERERLLEWLRCLRLFVRDLLAIYGGSAAIVNADLETRLFAFSEKVSEDWAFAVAREATETARRIETSNAAPRLAIESFMLKTGKRV